MRSMWRDAGWLGSSQVRAEAAVGGMVGAGLAAAAAGVLRAMAVA